MGAQYGKFDVKGRIKHHVSCFLEGEYPLIFSLTHIGPLGNRFTGSEGSFVVVADDAA